MSLKDLKANLRKAVFDRERIVVAGGSFSDGEIAQALKEIKALEDALLFYSKPETWQSLSTGFVAQYDRAPSDAEKDRGQLARNTLSQGVTT